MTARVDPLRVTGLGGGIGASRLWRPLADELGDALTLVVNTGEDFVQHGLRICPDLDTVLYALSGRQDTARGWGLAGESFRAMGALAGLGEPVWFGLGDQDLATHLLRTGLLDAGARLSGVTARLAAALGVVTTVLPMSDDEVVTTVDTVDGRSLLYEEWLVREGCRPEVRATRWPGAASARPAPGVLAAIADADVVVIGPSNPVASVLPILELPGVRAALQARRDRVIAISPIVGVPIVDEGEARRARSRSVLMTALGLRPDPAGVASAYADVCGTLVLDPADAGLADEVEAAGVRAVLAPLLLHCGAPAGPLLDVISASGAPAFAE